MTNRIYSEYKYLDWVRTMLDNATSQPEIAAALAIVGYDAAVIAAGKQVYQTAKKVFDKNKTEDDETRDARKAYKTKIEELTGIFKPHRAKAKVIFRNDQNTQEKLMISGSFPNSYPTLIQRAEKFYNTLNADSPLQEKVAVLKITPKEIKKGLQAISELQSARNIYQAEIGESQEATKAKDGAITDLENWVKGFKDIAQIALEDQPQLQEALGILVRS